MWLVALGLLTLVRLAVAGATPLSPDEAYYWVWSRALAPGYLDHPAMVALWIRGGTALLGQEAAGIRLFAPLSACVGTLFVAGAAEDLFPGRQVWLPAAVLLNATLLFGAGAVTMTPDTPLLFFWCGAVWALARLVRTGQPGWWIVAGAMAGGASDSKYTALLLGVGIGLWLLIDPAARRWLRTPWPWAGGALAGIIFAPTLVWNADHDWVSLAKQGGRTGDWRPGEAARFLGELVGSQIGLATPLAAILFGIGIGLATRRFRQGSAPAMLAALTVPGVALFLQHALGDRVQANWPAVLYPAASIAAAAYCPWFWRSAAWLGFAVTALVYIQAATALLPLPRGLDPTLIRLGGWDSLTRQIALRRPSFVAAENYGLAAVLAHGLPSLVVGVDARWAVFDLPRTALAGQQGLLIRSARRAAPPDAAPWTSIEPAGMLVRSRDGMVAESYDLYRVTARGDMVHLPDRHGALHEAANP